MQHELLSRELVRALRGKRSQPWLSRRIGLKSNLVYRWEAGRAWPSATQFCRIWRVSKQRGPLALERFLGTKPPKLESERGVPDLLGIIAGPLGVSALAERLGKSRFVVSRWLSGKTEIRLPELLRFVEASTLRLLDFLSVLLEPASLPSAAEPWRRLQAARSAAYDVPWSHAVLRALELADYPERKCSDERWVADRLGIDVTEARRSLALLLASGQIRRSRGRYRVESDALIDTGVEPERRRALRAFWSRTASERLELGTPGVHAFNLFALAESDIPKVQELHAEFFGRLRALVASSDPPERLFLYAAQIVPLDEHA